jgi:hypothetical protein
MVRLEFLDDEDPGGLPPEDQRPPIDVEFDELSQLPEHQRPLLRVLNRGEQGSLADRVARLARIVESRD